MEAFEKVIRPGAGHDGSLFCSIKYDGKRLSITGVEGPKANGDARGSCGQCVDALDRLTLLAEEWTPALVAQFKTAWERWHLNDMRAGCEHQRATWNPMEQLEIVTYRLTASASQQQREIRRAALLELQSMGSATATAEEQALLALPWETTQAPDAESAASGQYEVSKRETRSAGWITEREHSRGLLSKPCDVCGYEYGSAWLFEEVPEDVLEWLASLPDTDRTPAWI